MLDAPRPRIPPVRTPAGQTRQTTANAGHQTEETTCSGYPVAVYWLLLAFTVAPAHAPALAQSYPSRPITIIVPLAAGTGMDTLARLYSEQLSQALGKPVVIENKPGAGLMLGTAAIASAPPDGHTLGISTATPMAVNQVLYKKMSYDPDKDLTPVYFYVKSPFVLVVNPALPINSVPELIKYAKESANPMSYSTPGAGTSQHLAMEFMAQRFGLKVTHVPYRNSPQSITDIAAGHVNLGFAEAGASLPLIREGKLRALAVSSLVRLPTLPDVPPFGEAAGRARFRSGVLAHPVRAGGNAERDRRAPARRHAAHHVGARHEETRRGYRPAPARFASDRRHPRLRQIRAGEVGLPGQEARPRRHAITIAAQAAAVAPDGAGLRPAIVNNNELTMRPNFAQRSKFNL